MTAASAKKLELPTAAAILAALRRAPASMAVPPSIARYTELPVRWKDKGRGWGGCDCWGLCCLVYAEERGVVLPDDVDAYDAKLLSREAKRAELATLADIIRRHRLAAGFTEIAFEDARLFDFLELPIAGEPCHIALYVGDLHILHIEEGCDAVCEDLREPYWHGRLRHARVYRYAGGARC